MAATYPTRYATMSDDDFYASFRNSSWAALSDEDRVEVLQEAVNRSAALNGEQGSCRVTFSDDMGRSTCAAQGGDRIEVNRSFYGQGHDGSPTYGAYKDPGFRALETVLHEDRHAWQNQVVDGRVDAPAEQARAFRANQGSLVVIDLEDGSTAAGSTYFTGGRNGEYHYLYMAQPVEADAFRTSEARTDAIAARQLELMAKEYQTAPTPELAADIRGAHTYRTDLQSRGYDRLMAAAGEDWCVDDLEKEVSTTLTNLYEGRDEEVDPVVELGVYNASVSAVNDMYASQSSDQSQGASIDDDDYSI